ncbi:MAG: ABC transporter permease [Fuerstiella sp.]|nr:ABC transporter permease [Fuerstiella sp.]
MADQRPNQLHRFVSGYGMIFVLLLLMLLFTILTWKKQTPVGADAGHTVAETILAQNAQAVVIVVAGASDVEQAFVQAAEQRLSDGGATVARTVSGNPSDARRTITSALDDGVSLTHVAVSGIAERWTVFDRFDAGDLGQRVSPQPYSWPVFAQTNNLLSVANQTAIYAVIAVGMTMVIITGGIDLSVGSLVALASVMAAIVIREMGGVNAGPGAMLTGVAAALGICSAAGGFHGVMVTRFHIPPFIVSLSMMMMARGLAYLIADGTSISALPESWTVVGSGTALGIPIPVLMMIVLYGVAHVVMTHTALGRYVYAVGGNQEAARLCGVPVRRVLVTVYITCGTLAGLGGLILSSKLATGDPKLGMMYELEVIAAVVVGGTSLMGGEGRILGTLIGAFIIAVIKNGMNLLNVGAYEQQIILGAVLLIAVLIDNLKRQRSGGVS